MAGLGTLFAAAPTAMATHEDVTWHDYLPEWTSTARAEQRSVILEDGKGTSYVFMISEKTGDSSFTNLTFARCDNHGFYDMPSCSGGVVVNSDINVVQYDSTPSAVRDHSGNLYVAWTHTAAFSPTASMDIYVSKSTDNGTTWGTAVAAGVGAGTASDTQPALAVTPGGRLYLAWKSVSGSTTTLYARYSDDGAATWSSPVVVTSVTDILFFSYDIPALSLATDSRGRAYVVYSIAGYVFIFLSSGTVSSSWTDAGTSWSTPKALSPSDTIALNPALAVDSQDRAHVAWVDWRQAGTQNTVYYRRSDDRGGNWTTEVRLNEGAITLNAGSSPIPSIATYRDNVMVAWVGSPSNWVLSYAVSATGGASWYPEQYRFVGAQIYFPSLAADENGTFWATVTDLSAFPDYDVGLMWWNAPPTTPSITGIVRGDTSLTVSWSAAVEYDVTRFEVYRSLDGATYELLAVTNATTTSYTNTGLAQGLYWYRIVAVDYLNVRSHSSDPASATVGMTTAEMIDALEAQITALQNSLNAAQSDIDALQTALTTLQNSIDTKDAATQQKLDALQAQIDALEAQLSTVQSQQATQGLSFVNLGIGIVIVLLLVLIFLQMRKPKNPTMMMAESPKKIEEEL